MNNYILFHVPHSSLKIPKCFWSICIKDKKYIDNSNLFMCDYLTYDLLPNKCKNVTFKYSRLFCDVEKFKDDSKETMASKGMGFVYTNDCNGLICIPNNKYKNKIIKSFYNKHHNKLDKVVSNILNKYNKCLIIDLHSFSDEMVDILFNSKDNPDICIGVYDKDVNSLLLKFTLDYFNSWGYKVKVNYPYSGTIIPNKFINKNDDRLSSIMLEINKRIYINNIKDFNRLKECINIYYNQVKDII